MKKIIGWTLVIIGILVLVGISYAQYGSSKYGVDKYAVAAGNGGGTRPILQKIPPMPIHFF